MHIESILIQPSLAFPAAAAARAPDRAHWLASCVTEALVTEAQLTPKPGLCDARASGAHIDLSLSLLVRSARDLQPFFQRMATEAEGRAVTVNLREQLGELGRQAEVSMLRATEGVNTHRGAIWALGLLVASAGICGSGASANRLCETAGRLANLPDRYAGAPPSNGTQAFKSYGATGARGEAMAAFPHVLRAALPCLRRTRALGGSETEAQLDALLVIMATLDDTCLLHRGGKPALLAAQDGARQVLRAGGTANRAGKLYLADLDRRLLRLWVSPGGSADLLAATLFVDRLTTLRRSEP
ncbi:triphosphoribosyl-dephospho-CoA synthase [Granulicella arctica]|uniref:triphosphoribosyl-dephospho-CoA synthase n=1 Tax=Granulicella arctica TaxID=940613 RepID=A0A7Y9TT20_9BACT|nr:triphosphoribosyl-dephospho-CoA synthase [Granulicella arctica]